MTRKRNYQSPVLHILLTLALTLACVFSFAAHAKAAVAGKSLANAGSITPGESVTVSFTDRDTGVDDDSYFYAFTMTNGGEFSVTNVCTSGEEDDTAQI